MYQIDTDSHASNHFEGFQRLGPTTTATLHWTVEHFLTKSLFFEKSKPTRKVEMVEIVEIATHSCDCLYLFINASIE